MIRVKIEIEDLGIGVVSEGYLEYTNQDFEKDIFMDIDQLFADTRVEFEKEVQKETTFLDEQINNMSLDDEPFASIVKDKERRFNIQ